MKKSMLLALLGLLLVACGGDGGDDILDNTGGNGGGSEPTLTLTRAQVVGNWKDTYGRNSLTEDWVAVANPFIHCFDEDGTYRTLYQGKKMSEGTWTITGNKIVVTATLYTDTYEVLSLEGNEMEFAYYSNGTLTNYGRVVRTEEDVISIEKKTFTANGVTFTMVAVEGGTFQMGAPDSDTEADIDEKPQHAVTLSDFYIGETEVTQALWKAVMGSNPSNFVGDQLPVEKVSWYDCQTFIRKLNEMTGQTFRLPTEAEWEYAARGGNQSKGYKYSGSNDIDLVVWYIHNSGYRSHEVATKTANELGLYDMSGNVAEWCQDWYSSDYYSSEAQTNPTGPATGAYRVHRGGTYDEKAKFCRVLRRRCSNPSYSIDMCLGLRLVMSK